MGTSLFLDGSRKSIRASLNMGNIMINRFSDKPIAGGVWEPLDNFDLVMFVSFDKPYRCSFRGVSPQPGGSSYGPRFKNLSKP